MTLTAASLLAAGCPPPAMGPDGGDGIFTWGTVSDFLSSAPIEGVHVCLKDTDTCDDTGTDGAFVVEGLGESEDILVSFDDNRYFPAVGHFNTARAVEFDWAYTLPTEDAVALQVSLAGETLERGVGQVFFAAAVETGHNKPRVPGITVTPSEGSEGLGEPVYGNDLSVPDPNLTETSNGGTAVFSNVEPGIYFFEVTGQACSPYFAMDSPDDGVTYSVHVFANTLSAVTVVCPQ